MQIDVTPRIKVMLIVLAVTASLGLISVLWPGANSGPVRSTKTTTTTTTTTTSLPALKPVDLPRDAPEGCVVAVGDLRKLTSQGPAQLDAQATIALGDALRRLDGFCPEPVARAFRERELNRWANGTA